LLAACHRNEVTLSLKDLEHSVLTYHLLVEMQSQSRRLSCRELIRTSTK